MANKYKIVHDREVCIGCAACASVCPKYWIMGSDGKSNIVNAIKTGNGEEETIGPLEVDFDSNHEAADSCPVNCIHIFEIKEDGKENKLI